MYQLTIKGGTLAALQAAEDHYVTILVTHEIRGTTDDGPPTTMAVTANEYLGAVQRWFNEDSDSCSPGSGFPLGSLLLYREINVGDAVS